ncbi:MAG: hypothetical protein M1827_003326 [Pycnora praestabilis]|nr:MAG: hypothetical protein M1827_003326 [Pycnora praestabilis]
MSKKATVPDAWDDDWEAQADKSESNTAAHDIEAAAKASKADRKAKHAEQNKKLWDSAESTETFHFLEARNNVPLKTEFKPALKVLSRKPTPKVIARTDPTSGISQLTLEDEDDDDEDDAKKKNALTPEERRLKADREREEKQRRYEEVRERLFGTSTSGSGRTTPENGVVSSSKSGSDSRNAKSKGKSRGDQDGRPGSSTSKRVPKVALNGQPRQLYDPSYTIKPDSVSIQKRDNPSSSGRSSPGDGQQPIRAPKGPDGSGRGGFGFASRGDRTV